MKTIYKYTIPIDRPVTHSIPGGYSALPLYVDTQHRDIDKVQVWFLVDTDAPSVDRTFIVVGTGTPFPVLDNISYIGTAKVMEGTLMWHVLEIPIDHATHATN